jgi:DNA modification methylase
VQIEIKQKIKKFNPENFEQECTTVWSFARRGNWATHNSKYRGNWAPEVVRNLILRYSKEGDYLLDPMIGGGTTAIECKLLNRNLLALDINQEAIELTKKALEFESEHNPKIKIKLNDSRKLDMLQDESIDFILNHPPYADIIKYSDKKIKEDLSNIHDLDEFCDEMEKVAILLNKFSSIPTLKIICFSFNSLSSSLFTHLSITLTPLLTISIGLNFLIPFRKLSTLTALSITVTTI